MDSVSKSYTTNDPVKDYCIKHSSPLHPVQHRLLQVSIFNINLIILTDIVNPINKMIEIIYFAILTILTPRRRCPTAGAG